MLELTPSQEACAELALRHIPTSARPSAPLLVGASGVGKRVIAHAVADRLGCDFAEIPLQGSSDDVMRLLTGLVLDSERLPRSLGGSEKPVFVYLSHVEGAPVRLHQTIHALTTRRMLLVPEGRDVSLSEDMIVSAGYTEGLAPSLPLSHWLVQAFRPQIPVPTPNPAELDAVVSGIASELGLAVELTPAAPISYIAGAPGRLHEVRRLVELIAQSISGRSIVTADLHSALLKRSAWALGRVQYRGDDVTPEHIDAWLAQFPRAMVDVAVTILWEIGSYYFVGDSRYYASLRSLVDSSGVARGARVHFCSWQDVGRSAPRVANDLRNLAGWRIGADIDLQQPTFVWPRRLEGDQIFLADDMIGSGDTLRRLTEAGGPLARLLDHYPRAVVIIAFVIGFAGPLRAARQALRAYGNRVRILVDRLLTDEDRCFTDNSRIFPDRTDRQRLRDFCIEVAGRQMNGLPRSFYLGYGDTGALIVFANGVPNNTLPFVWFDGADWTPLFPAAGVIS